MQVHKKTEPYRKVWYIYSGGQYYSLEELYLCDFCHQKEMEY